MNYSYNIKEMLGANRNLAKSTGSSSYFGFDLGYDKTAIAATGGSTIGNYSAHYNGNIVGMV